jgi:prephenate dehydrogenase
MAFERISIIGVGLLGGSIGMAVKSGSSHCHVVGYGHRRDTLEKALEFGAIDEAAGDLGAAVKGADLVILCTPVGLFESILKEIGGKLKAGAVVTDVGSTKRSVVRAGEALVQAPARFVGSHPMAGSEKRGVEFARPDLFQNALCIVTPTGNTDQPALESVEGFWKALGMRVTRVSPEKHDELLAEVSHLPHAVAAALMSIQAEEGMELCGKGFLDTTRVAGGDGGLWRDILLDNGDNVRGAIRKLVGELAKLEELIEKKDGKALSEWLDRASRRREELGKRKLKEMEG